MFANFSSSLHGSEQSVQRMKCMRVDDCVRQKHYESHMSVCSRSRHFSIASSSSEITTRDHIYRAASAEQTVACHAVERLQRQPNGQTCVLLIVYRRPYASVRQGGHNKENASRLHSASRGDLFLCYWRNPANKTAFDRLHSVTRCC